MRNRQAKIGSTSCHYTRKIILLDLVEEGDEGAAAADDDKETDVAPARTCLNGLPAEYCAAVVQLLLYIGLFIGGFINLR